MSFGVYVVRSATTSASSFPDLVPHCTTDFSFDDETHCTRISLNNQSAESLHVGYTFLCLSTPDAPKEGTLRGAV